MKIYVLPPVGFLEVCCARILYSLVEISTIHARATCGITAKGTQNKGYQNIDMQQATLLSLWHTDLQGFMDMVAAIDP